MKRLIVTADDFGMSVEVNNAIEKAHRQGILTTASLMVGAGATADAIDRLKWLPTLRVGLHLVLVDGAPLLPVTAIPDLLDSKGYFPPHLVREGIRFFFSLKVRRQLEVEVRAQFQAFQRIGVPLDHVNVHHHMVLHPTVSGILLRVGREFGLRAIRLPYEQPLSSWRASGKGLLRRAAAAFFLYPWIVLLRNRILQSKMCSNDFVFGMYDSGHMDLDLLLRILHYLPEGVTEIYFHPACDGMYRRQEDRGGQKEYEALTSPALINALQALRIQVITFSDL